jgi:hypothetical protein
VSIDYPIVRTFTRKCPPASPYNPNPQRVFPTAVISCELDKENLPLVMNSGTSYFFQYPSSPSLYHPIQSTPICHATNNLILACRTICEIKSDFSSLPLALFKLKNRHWWNKGQKYHRIEYCVKVVLGPADVRFELWYNGRRLSEDNSIQVEWHTAKPPPEPQATGLEGSGQQWQPAMDMNLNRGGQSPLYI